MQDRQFNGSVTVDCANGVGGPKLRELIKHLTSPSEGGLEIKVVNDDVLKPERLNHQVGASSTFDGCIEAKRMPSSVVQTLSRQISEHPLHRMRLL